MKKFLVFIGVPFFCVAAFAHTINWHVGDQIISTTTCSSGDNITPPTAPAKLGYHFKEWITPYIKLEYIESTGTQYIDTRINQVYQQEVSLEFSFTPTELIGFFGGNGSTQYGIKSSFGFAVGINSVAKVVYDGTDSTLYRDGSIVETYTWGTTYSGLPIGLFALGMANNSFTNQTKGKLYYAKIYGASGSLVRNFIPAKRTSDNAIGMYDTVTSTFFTNAGTGAFNAGPEVGYLQ